MKRKPELILNRTKTCNCGCGGSDPWHQKYYRRVVKQTSETEGTVTMPYSNQPVRVTRTDFGTGSAMGLWRVDRDSIIFDKG